MYCQAEHRCSECNRKRTLHIKRLKDTTDLSCAWGFVLIVCFLWQWRQLKKFLCSQQSSHQLFLFQDQDAVRRLCKNRWEKPHWSPPLPFCSRPAFILRSLPELYDDVSLLVTYLTDPDFDLISKLVLGPATSLWTHTVIWAVADPGYHHWMYSALLAGGLWGCISCGWGPCTAGHAITFVLISLHPVAQPQLLPDIQFHNSFNGSKLWLLEVCFCPYRSLSPLHRPWYLSDFIYLFFQEMKQL